MRPRRVAGLVAVLVLGAAAPVFAQVMPLAGSARPPRAALAGDAGPDGAERDAAFVTAGLGFGQSEDLGGDLQLGWMLAPWIGVFASLGGLVAQDSASSLQGVGVRLASGAVFADGRIASRAVHGDCDFDKPCSARTSHVGIIGAGLEFVHLRHFALDLHVQVVIDRRDVLALGGFGLGFYL